MTTVVVIITNCNNRICQSIWCSFIEEFNELCEEHGTITFSGDGYGRIYNQDTCFIVDMESGVIQAFMDKVSSLGKKFKNGGRVAVTIGATQLV